MSSKRNKAASGQLDLGLDVFTVALPGGDPTGVVGESAIDAGLRKAIACTLDQAFKSGLSRERVADLMSAALGRPLTKAMLDQWAAPSQTEKRIPADALIALMAATENLTVLEWMAYRFDRRLLTDDEALCAEYGAMAVLDRHIAAKQRNIRGRMDEKLLDQVMLRMQKAQK